MGSVRITKKKSWTLLIVILFLEFTYEVVGIYHNYRLYVYVHSMRFYWDFHLIQSNLFTCNYSYVKSFSNSLKYWNFILTCPDRDSNLQPSDLQSNVISTTPHSQMGIGSTDDLHTKPIKSIMSSRLDLLQYCHLRVDWSSKTMPILSTL